MLTEADSSCSALEVVKIPLKILIADDETMNRMLLSAILSKDGHRVVEACNGAEAVDVFVREQPDIVLMDVMMPVMDGYETTRRIKQVAGERFVPVIFLTALSDEQSLVRCIESGGDDFLTKPYKRVILQAKIEAMERVRQLYTVLKSQKDELAQHHRQLQREQETAERLFATIVHPSSLGAAQIKYLLSPMALFNGDLLLAAPKPSGGLHVLLGDFTGHGLPAAIGSLPVSELFYAMTQKGFAIGDIVAEINQKLRRILPTGIFFAVCCLEFNAAYNTLSIWNGGIPGVVVRGSARDRLLLLESRHLPLGVVDGERLDRQVELIDLEPGDRIYAYTDGMIEASNPALEMFGTQRLKAHFTEAQDLDHLFETICADLASFRAGGPQDDDITFIEINRDAALANTSRMPTAAPSPSKPMAHWQLTLDLAADALRAVDPLPQIMQMVMDIQGLYDHRERIYTILAELFSNALDHGLLGLDSALKHSPQGFSVYYTAREQALAALQAGHIRISLTHIPLETGGKLVIEVSDSGPGFDHDTRITALADNTTYSGRGIPLLRSLCHKLCYHGVGNHVEAVYVWQ
jgi:CheY-like chemotaxis protein/signal transduction histidine kinase